MNEEKTIIHDSARIYSIGYNTSETKELLNALRPTILTSNNKSYYININHN